MKRENKKIIKTQFKDANINNMKIMMKIINMIGIMKSAKPKMKPEL